MKLLMIILDETVRDEVEATLDKHEVNGYTEIPMAFGEGKSGKKLASRLHPGANSIVFSIIDDDRLDPIKADLMQTCAAKTDENCPKPIHIAVLKVEEFF